MEPKEGSPAPWLCPLLRSISDVTTSQGHDRLLGPLASRRRMVGRRPCPRFGSTSRARGRRQTSPFRTPKGSNYGPHALSPA